MPVRPLPQLLRARRSEPCSSWRSSRSSARARPHRTARRSRGARPPATSRAAHAGGVDCCASGEVPSSRSRGRSPSRPPRRSRHCPQMTCAGQRRSSPKNRTCCNFRRGPLRSPCSRVAGVPQRALEPSSLPNRTRGPAAMEFGIFNSLYTPRQTFADVDDQWSVEDQRLDNEVAWTIAADKAGFKYTWATEHHFLTEYSHLSANEVFLPYVAAKTERIRIGTGIFNI